MQPGEIIALAGLVITIFTAIAGLLIKARDERITELVKERDALVNRNEVLERTLDAKQETINEQHRQLDRLIVTAEIQEKFFSKLPRHISSPEARQ